MSHKGNDSYLENLEIAEQDYKDDLVALENAKEEVSNAYEWQKKMELKCNESARKLQALKNKEF